MPRRTGQIEALIAASGGAVAALAARALLSGVYQHHGQAVAVLEAFDVAVLAVGAAAAALIYRWLRRRPED
ncbi:hypothetical protein ACFU7Y_21285 [Kitasatospora sp. NPDC057542]|uniref:hypothetical protein n=1 Tax=Streptomycetaceae TaxID=2062 RepID=UPI001CCEDC8E|nr:hypothetical protein [Streptomyces sp. LS1784]